jgi:hypothetical protein
VTLSVLNRNWFSNRALPPGSRGSDGGSEDPCRPRADLACRLDVSSAGRWDSSGQARHTAHLREGLLLTSFRRCWISSIGAMASSRS